MYTSKDHGIRPTSTMKRTPQWLARVQSISMKIVVVHRHCLKGGNKIAGSRFSHNRIRTISFEIIDDYLIIVSEWFNQQQTHLDHESCSPVVGPSAVNLNEIVVVHCHRLKSDEEISK